MTLTHDGGPYHIENSPLICFYMIGTSVVKELIRNCHTHTYRCKWDSNHKHGQHLIKASLLQPVDYTNYDSFIPSFSKYAGIYRPNKLPSSKIFCVVFRFPNFSYQKDQAAHSQNLRYLKIKKKFTIIVDYFEFKNILNIELIQLGL